MKSAVVFGGAGFIGSHLLESLVQSQEYSEVVSVDIRDPSTRLEGVTYRRGDVTQPIDADICETPPDEIYNLAAVHTTPGHEDWEYYWTNVMGALNVCEFARQTAASKLLFTSSIAVYGPSEELKTELSKPNPESAYGRSKLAAEKIHQNWLAEKEGRKLRIVRPAVIYGHKEGGNFSRLAKLLSRGVFLYPGRKDTIKSCGYVEDLVRSFKFSFAKPEIFSLYNFAFPDRFTSEDICKAFCTVKSYREPSIVIPIKLMLSGAWLFEIASKLGLRTSINRPRIQKLFRSTNIFPQYLVDNKFDYKFSLPKSLERWNKRSKVNDFD